ncbi:MAG: M23 family metallopeptidase [Myxococcota bacterium]
MSRIPWIIAGCLLAGCTAEHVTDPAVEPMVTPPSGVFALPLEEPDRYYQTIGIDHDGTAGGEGIAAATACRDYDDRPFPWCYDGHTGSDYLLRDGWESMDAGSTGVLAAADGVVIEVEDGNYDRCHLSVELGDVDCDGHDGRPNIVRIDHGRGLVSSYYHLMNGSIVVEVGQEVRCGEPLARVGSSGYSSFPHLHFQVARSGERVDPYEGVANDRPSLWLQQNGNTELPSPECP